MSARNNRGSAAKSRIVQEAARLFVEQALPDYGSAKRKALDFLRLKADTTLPSDQDVEAAVLEYQRLFKSDRQPEVLREMREAALSLMRRLSDFSPRLTGPVLAGVGGEHDSICLHVFADPPEKVDWFFMERHIRFETGESRVRLSGGVQVRVPRYVFEYRGWEVKLLVFSGRAARQVPVNRSDGRVVERVSMLELEALLEAVMMRDVAS